MKMQDTLKALFLGSLLIGGTFAYGQDAHFSQYDAVAPITNPALTGMYKRSDFRISTDLRSQWSKLSSNFLTTALAYDANVSGRFGFGGHLTNYDQAGMLNTFQLGGLAAYNVAQSNAPYILSVGANLGFIYKKVNDADLLFDSQYDDGHFDEDLPSGEIFVQQGRFMPEVSIGFAYRSMDGRKMFNPFANFAAFHVNTPDEAIIRVEAVDLPIRWSAVVGSHIDVTEELRISPSALFMMQNSDMQLNIGSMGNYTIGNGVYGAVFGASYRMQDAIILHAGLKHRKNVYRVSYDVPTSGLSQYTGIQGAIEFSIVYFGTHSGRASNARKQDF